MALSGFRAVEVIDLDTIDISKYESLSIFVLIVIDERRLSNQELLSL